MHDWTDRAGFATDSGQENDQMIPYARQALLPMALLQIFAPVLPLMGLGESIGDRAVAEGIPPELPLGIFFSIWSLIFLGYLIVAVLAWRDPDSLPKGIAAPLALAGLGNAAWIISARLFGLPWLDFLLLIPILLMAWEVSQRLDLTQPDPAWQRRVLDGTAGLLSGWLTVAVSISVPDVVRWALEWGPSDHIWYSLWLTLIPAALLAWLFASRFSRSWWYFAALSWGLVGIIANNWLRTETHALAIATFIVGAYVLRRRWRFGARGAVVPEQEAVTRQSVSAR